MRWIGSCNSEGRLRSFPGSHGSYQSHCILRGHSTVLPVRDHERGSVDQVRAAQKWAAARKKPNGGSAQRGERRGGQSANTGRGGAGSGVHGIRGATPPMTTRVVQGRLRRPRRGGVAVATLTLGQDDALSGRRPRLRTRAPRGAWSTKCRTTPACGRLRKSGPVHNSIRGGEVSEQSTSFRGMHAQRPRPPPWRDSCLARCGA